MIKQKRELKAPFFVSSALISNEVIQEIDNMALHEITANINDVDLINRLMRRSKASWGYTDEFLDQFMGYFQVTPATFASNHMVKLFCQYEAEKDNVIGFYSLSFKKENECELDNFFIDSPYISQGYGKKMWHSLIKNLSEQRQKEFIIWSDPYAESFYEKMGCSKIGIRQSPLNPDRCPAIFKYCL